MTIQFEGKIWFWQGPAPWYFVTVPVAQCSELQALSSAVTYGWGMIPVEAQTGESVWETSLWPKDGRYIVPIKASVREVEKLDKGDTVIVNLTVRL